MTDSNDVEPPGDGGGGAAVPELPLAQVVSDVLASPSPLTFKEERVTPTRVSPRNSSSSLFLHVDVQKSADNNFREMSEHYCASNGTTIVGAFFFIYTTT